MVGVRGVPDINHERKLLRYGGCKLESLDKSGQPLLFEQYGWDAKSAQTLDGSPVVEISYTSPTTLLVDEGGDLQAE